MRTHDPQSATDRGEAPPPSKALVGERAYDRARPPLAERAAAELRASGETARKRDVSTQVKLTPMD